MIAVLTGDIKNSRDDKSLKWLTLLKDCLNKYGEESKGWEIYRGDSFQLETSPKKALEASIYIKACIKQIKNLDVRIAIGLGEKLQPSKKITEANGSAFINSGACFEDLRKKTLAIKSPKVSFNAQQNLLLELALLTMNNWTPAISKTVKTAMDNPSLNQVELAKKLGKSQGNISEELTKSGYDEIKKMMHFYTAQLQNL